MTNWTVADAIALARIDERLWVRVDQVKAVYVDGDSVTTMLTHIPTFRTYIMLMDGGEVSTDTPIDDVIQALAKAGGAA